MLLLPVVGELIQSLRLLIRQFLEPARHRLASQVASDPRPPLRLLAARVDGEGVDLDVCHENTRGGRSGYPGRLKSLSLSCVRARLRLATPSPG